MGTQTAAGLDMPWGFPLAAALSSLSSTVASLILFLWICKLKGSLGGRLIARQLWHLALADVFASFLLFPWYTMATLRAAKGPVFLDYQDELNIMCAVCHVNNIPYMASVFTELHIAIAAMATILRSTTTLKVLSKILPFVWVGGLIIGGSVEILANVVWDSKSGGCNPGSNGEGLKAGVMAAVLVICIAIYAVGMCVAAQRHGGSVEGRAWRRASVFIAAAVVTWVPFVVFVFRPKEGPTIYDSTSKRWYYVMSVFLEANGLLNTMVYAWQSGFLRKTQHRAQYMCDLQETASQLPPEVSFNVAFRSQVEERIVPALTAAANHEADMQANALRGSSWTDSVRGNLLEHTELPAAPHSFGCRADLVMLQPISESSLQPSTKLVVLEGI